MPPKQSLFSDHATVRFVVDAPLMHYDAYNTAEHAAGRSVYYALLDTFRPIVHEQFERNAGILCVVANSPTSENPRLGVVCTTAAAALALLGTPRAECDQWTPCRFWFTWSRAEADAAVDAPGAQYTVK